MPPTSDADLVRLTAPPSMSLALEPVHNAINSLVLLNKYEQSSGLGEWVTRTAAELSPELRHGNRLVFEGLYYAIQPDRRWPSFPAFLEDLAGRPPERLRERWISLMCRAGTVTTERDIAALLDDVGAYLDYLHLHFEGVDIDDAIETETHRLLNDPPAMQQVVVEHMRAMWEQTLGAEWERVKPLLQESIAAFSQIDLKSLSPNEAIRAVIGHDVHDKWEKLIETSRQIIFVPSAHLGPYARTFAGDGTLWLLFGARLPAGAPVRSSALGRSDLLVRLSAITDDIRLRILELLSRHDELCAQDIMNRLDLTQSAVSRHLRQLSATGYVTERRREVAKCYSLNRERIDDTFHALQHFLESDQEPNEA